MNVRRMIHIALVAIALLGAFVFAAAPAIPHDELPGIKAAVENSRISLSRATALAVAAGAGYAIHAKLSTDPARPAYAVEVLVGNSLFNIQIDSRTGALISSSPDTPERDTGDAVDKSDDE